MHACVRICFRGGRGGEGEERRRSAVPVCSRQAAGVRRRPHDDAGRRQPANPQETGKTSSAPRWPVRVRPRRDGSRPGPVRQGSR